MDIYIDFFTIFKIKNLHKFKLTYNDIYIFKYNEKYLNINDN